jgi:cytochrome P450
MVWLLLVGTAVTAMFLSSSFSLLKNYLEARRLGVPTRITLACGYNPIFGLAGKTLMDWCSRLPWPLTNFAKYSYYGWSVDDKGESYRKYGPIWANVSSWGNEYMIADPDAVMSITSRWKLFKKGPGIETMEIFGKNVDTVEGNDWYRHRKLTAPCFNERSSRLVWDESVKQAKPMLEAAVRSGSRGTDALGDDTQTIALHVLTRVAFGLQNAFGEGTSKVLPGYQMSFREAIHIILGSLLLVMIVPADTLTSSFMPKHFRKVGLAAKEYDRYVRSIMDKEREEMKQGQDANNNLMSVLLRASETEMGTGSQKQRVTDSEITGNIFIFNVAGHDTTANTLAFAIAMLSTKPEVQDWLAEEINAVFGDEEDPDYETAYPQLVRCLATLVRLKSFIIPALLPLTLIV